MYRTRENFGILVKQREKIKRSFWNFLYLEKYYTTKSSNFLACLPNQNQSKGYVQLGFTNVSTHTASWLVKPGCLLIGWTLTFNISAQRPRNQNRQKEWTTRDPPYWLTHTDSWLVQPGCLLIGQASSSNISAHWPQNQNLTKEPNLCWASPLVNAYWLLSQGAFWLVELGKTKEGSAPRTSIFIREAFGTTSRRVLREAFGILYI